MSYAAPHDIMQDIISSKRILQGKSAYPEQMASLIKSTLRNEPPRWSLGTLLPDFKDKEQRENQPLVKYQAHPPLLVLLTVPVAWLADIHGTALLIDLLMLLGFAVTVLLIREGLPLRLSFVPGVALIAMTLCWSPVLSLLRQSQSGFFIASLIVLSWFLLRRKQFVAAGIPLGIAACLKVYPGLLLLYLLLRFRRALLGALAAMAVCAILPVPWMGWHSYSDYFHNIGGVVAMYGAQNHDISLLAAFRKNGIHISTAYLMVLGLVAVGVSVWLIGRGTKAFSDALLDLEYSLFIVLMLLLSPIVWDHYLVLLLLPLAVLGEQAFRSKPSWSGMFCLVCLVLVFSVPMDTYVLPLAARRISQFLNFNTSSTPTLAVIVLMAWTAWSTFQSGSTVSTKSAVASFSSSADPLIATSGDPANCRSSVRAG